MSDDGNDVKEEAPAIRIWGDSRLEKGERVVHPHTDQSAEPPPDLRSLRSVAPAPAARQLPEEDPTVNIELLTSDGAVLADVELELRDPVGDWVRARTSTDGRATFSVGDEGTYAVAFVDPPLVLPLPAEGAVGAGPGLQVTRTRTDPLWASTSEPGRPTRVVVRRPRCTEVLLDGYAEGSSVMRWGGTRWRTSDDGREVLGVTRAALRVPLELGAGRTIVCVGHTDPEGSDTANEDLGLERARSVSLFLQGDKDGWADHAAAHATELDEACALVAVSQIFGTPVALDDEKGLDRIHDSLLQWAGLNGRSLEAADQWRAVAEAYDLDLAALIHVGVEDLAARRSRVRFVDPASAGERWPRTDVAAPSPLELKLAQRRVAIVVVDEIDDPERASSCPDEVYDGTYSRKTIETPGLRLGRLRILDEQRQPVPRARAWLRTTGGLVVPYVADGQGVVELWLLEGESMHLVAANTLRGDGHVVTVGADVSP